MRWHSLSLKPLEGLLGALARISYRRPKLALIGLVLAGALAWPGLQRLRVDADLAHLLPSMFASVTALQQLEQRFGATGSIVVVLSGDEPQALRDYAERLVPELEALSSIRYVDYRRPKQWFEQRALLYLAPSQLVHATERLRARVDWELLQRNPLYVSLEDDVAPPLDIKDFEPEVLGELASTAGAKREYYEDVEAGLLVIFARPAFSSMDLGDSERALGEVTQVLERHSGPGRPKAQLTGRLQKKIEQKRQIQSDLSLASVIASLLVGLYLFWHFRSWRAVLALALPLFSGLWLGLGIAGHLYSELNILTAFVGAILIGLGIDHGIHLLAAYGQRMSLGASSEQAVASVFSKTGRVVVAAALTTIAGFVGLTISEFRAFREFGVVATIGLLAVSFAYWWVMPAWLRLVNYAPAQQEAIGSFGARWLRFLQQHGRVVGGAFAGTLLLLLLPLRGIQFDYDFAALEDSNLPAMRLDKTVNAILGHSQTPTVILTESIQQERLVAEQLRAAMHDSAVDSTLQFVLTLDDAVPKEQAAKLTQIQELRRQLDRLPLQSVNHEQREQLARLRSMTEVQAFTRSELPFELTRRFGARTRGEVPAAVLAFPAISLSDGAKIPRFAHEVRQASLGLPVAGDTMVLADILHMIDRESPLVMLSTLLLSALVILFVLRRWAWCLLAISASGLSIVGALSIHALFGGSLNYLNIVILPVLFGVSVDGTIHLLSADRESTLTVLRAIAGALLTTAFGFAPLTLAEHPGLQSVGVLALVGLGVNALISLILVPASLHLAGREAAGREVYA